MKKLLALLLVLSAMQAIGQQTPATTDTSRRRPVNDTSRRRAAPTPIGTMTPTRQTPAHDPVMVKQNNKYYLFTTGNGIAVFSSTDMKNWRKEAPVFSKTPDWVVKAIPRFRGGSMWAPDIS